jgi:TPR repeat protein
VPASLYLLGLFQYYGTAAGGGDAPAALRSFRAAAEAGGSGSGAAALAVGLLLEAGEGGSGGGGAPDAPAALPWYLRAGEAGEAEGLYRAGLLLFEGRARAPDAAPGAGPRGAREQDLALALRLLQRCAAAGFAPALDALGLMHEYGAHRSSGAQDFAAAAALYDRGCHWAPEAGAGAGAGGGGGGGGGGPTASTGTSRSHSADAEACYHLALLHAYGRGVAQDFAAGAVLLARAGELSAGGLHAPAALLLGRMHANGQGVPIDYQAALAHLARARDSGDARAAGEAGRLYAALDAQVQQAEVGVAGVLAELQAGLLQTQPRE